MKIDDDLVERMVALCRAMVASAEAWHTSADRPGNGRDQMSPTGEKRAIIEARAILALWSAEPTVPIATLEARKLLAAECQDNHDAIMAGKWDDTPALWTRAIGIAHGMALALQQKDPTHG